MNDESFVHPAQAQQGVRVLHPGDVLCAERGQRLETLLGSCVAVLLTDPRRSVGAMCHIVHAGYAAIGAAPSGAYAHIALETLYELLRVRGINPLLCEAYVFGGGNMFPQLFQNTHVGDDNARWALQALNEDGVPVLQQDLGGERYRRIGWTIGHEPEVCAVDMPTVPGGPS